MLAHSFAEEAGCPFAVAWSSQELPGVPRQLWAAVVEMVRSEVHFAVRAGSVQHQAAVVVEHIDRSGLLFWKVATAVVVLVHMKLVQVLPQRRAWQEDMKPVAAASCRLFGWSSLFELRGR